MRNEQQSLRGAWLALTGLSAVFLVEMLDNSVLTVALPTIGRELAASTTALQWVTGAYSVVFGGLMLVFGAAADRFGRRRMMVVGLVLLGLASLATAFVATAEQLVAVRAAMGAAAAMTAPGAGALAFRLFDDEGLRVRAITLISTVGLVGLAVGPTLGGLVLAVAPWQVLLLVNVPIATLAIVAVRRGIAADAPEDLHRVPLDVPGALLGTTTVVLALVTPTLFVEVGHGSWFPWTAAAAAVVAAVGFVVRQRTARDPLLDLALLARPLVSGGLAYKAAAGLATAGLGYLVTLQLQFAWGWAPAAAALGMLPQVVVLLAAGPFVNPLVQRVGIHRAAWLGAGAIVVGLAVFTAFGPSGYVAVAAALALVAAGLRVAGVVAMVNVLQGLPANRTTIGAALSDTATEVTSGTGIAITGTILAALFTGSITTAPWSAAQAVQFTHATVLAGLVLTVLAAAMVLWAMARTRTLTDERTLAPSPQT
ncbi:MFS transporter [Actinomycetospora termitidis]|uniref:MFS transporter n=1 Tax=Actinomycetospora termitidis TaxID=3053470 RepID=A0ABT7M3I0_9PSEU|nr:MFS transporter [Actinomycetospora sp. Odt1-22]MDL5155228.1 MFS transporter [Actinomycetospora sp. Odt1-22]